MVERYGLTCYLCTMEIDPDEAHVDHVTPLSRGGAHGMSNVRPISLQSCLGKLLNKLLVAGERVGLRSALARDVAEPLRPNIVLFLADDFSQLDASPYSNKAIRTPNMQRLAQAGMTFTNAYVASPSCAPSRAALLTGRSQHAVGMRTVANFNTGFPHQRSHISDRAATIELRSFGT